eukprot:TRINITY_DN777_c0_g1_i4.p1 TRINITY_DN777_c0_g1~~TRINITY_DN777_c0_g1_i4.p1  ORF type:complete len:893 (-),score=210.46 TRINITY_DN777_c0_g1_i4:189-2867(-)
MALAPHTCQLHPKSFTSLPRFHASRLQFFSFSFGSSSKPSKKHHFCFELNKKQDPTWKSNNNNSNKTRWNFPSEEQALPKPSQSIMSNVRGKGSWIDKWSETRHPNLPKRPIDVLDYASGGVSSEDEEERRNASIGSSSTMERIVEKLKRVGYVDDDSRSERKERLPERGSVEDIFYVEEGILPNSRGGFDDEEVQFPWEKKPSSSSSSSSSSEKGKSRSRTSLAEMTLPESELRRLRHLAIRTKQKTKIGGAGVTQAIVDVIRDKWKTNEVVRLKCEGAPALNMKRMHEILERKTGGLVIWRSGSSVSLYRGVSYELPLVQLAKKQIQTSHEIDYNSSIATDKASEVTTKNVSDGNIMLLHASSAVAEEKKVPESSPEIKYENEVDGILDGLGPRFTDWPGCDPLPVDADLLPGVVHGYKPPFRILPYGVRSTLGLKEMTALRRLSRPLPPHFALGRSRQHQGLAVAMVTLWEKCSIAKIALKRGVQLTTSERIAEDIKKLTGGTVLSRNKDYIVLYRGKDFLSPAVTEALLERERLAKALQDEEEQVRLRASSSVISNVETIEEPGTAGTLGETLEADARWGKRLDPDHRNKMIRAAEVARHADLVRKLARKLAVAERKLTKAGKALAKVEEFLKPAERPEELESITDEERFMFRKLGLRMKAFLLLGRRGVFDGTVENMHLHWKYRELVKIIVKAKNFAQVRNVALSLEAESGGVLVCVDKISKGFAIIVFRGREYQRPPTLRPKNLLTKRKALARSIELQRREALNNHISTLQKRAAILRSELDQMELIKDQGDDELYDKLDSVYSNEDEDPEDEGDDAYLGTYDSADDESDDSMHMLHLETNFPCDNQNPMMVTGANASEQYAYVEPITSFTERSEAEEETGKYDSN